MAWRQLVFRPGKTLASVVGIAVGIATVVSVLVVDHNTLLTQDAGRPQVDPEADLLIHVIDVSSPCYQDQMSVVEQFLKELDLENIPCLKVYNKVDLIQEELVGRIKKEGGLLVSSLQPDTLKPFLIQAERLIGKVIGGGQGLR